MDNLAQVLTLSIWRFHRGCSLTAALLAAIASIAVSADAFSQGRSNVEKRPNLNVPPARIKQLSTQEIASIFERPTNSTQLLRNLKAVMDRDLLLQRAFLEDESLLKLVGGVSAARLREKQSGASADLFASPTVITVKSDTFENVTIQISTRNRSTVRGSTLHAWATLLGISKMTAAEVENVFGPDPVKAIDFGVSLHGDRYTPSAKGTFTYEVRWNQALGRHFEKRIVFLFNPESSRIPATEDLGRKVWLFGSPTDFDVNDTVKEIRLHEWVED